MDVLKVFLVAAIMVSFSILGDFTLYQQP